MRLRFGQCVFDAGSRELLRAGASCDLSPKAFQFLELLLETRPKALTKQEIHDRLWPDAFVSDSSLPRLAAEVRAAIGDDAKNPRLLRTVHRFGYAFCGAVSPVPDETTVPSSYRVVWGERQIPLLPGENILGRAPDARIQLDHGRVSRQHARIVVGQGKAVLEDLGSKNGTFVRGEPVKGPEELGDGDEICIGSFVLVFRDSGANSTTEGGA